MLQFLSTGLMIAALAASAPGSSTSPSVMDRELLRPHLIDIGGDRKLSFNCIGQGAPTVVFEQGGEGNISNWKKVQPAITAVTRTCFYDRAGFGYSDPSPVPITALSATDDLHAVLAAAGVKDPVMLVGHSIGGFYATVYADRFFEQVAGVVAVDSGFSGQVAPIKPGWRAVVTANTSRGEAGLQRCADLARAGRLSVQEPHDCFAWDDDQTPDEAAYRLYAVTRPNWYVSELSQSRNYFPSGDEDSVSSLQEAKIARSFGDMPMVVLSAENTPRDSWETDETHADFERHWRAGHQALAARSTRGAWRVVPEAGHFIQRDKPEAVIEAILSVIDRVRADHRAAATLEP